MSKAMSDFQEKWLAPGGFVPIDMKTTGALIAEITNLRASNAAKDTRIIRLKIERDAYLTALNKAAPEKARELAMRFEEKETV
jgi:hypothetical protein